MCGVIYIGIPVYLKTSLGKIYVTEIVGGYQV